MASRERSGKTKTPRFNPQHQAFLDTFLLELPGVVSGRMFGYPGYYVEGKLFACVYENGVGIKVPEALAQALIGQEGVTHFQPMGKAKMKQWIQIDRNRSEDYRQDREIFEQAVAFVASSASKTG